MTREDADAAASVVADAMRHLFDAHQKLVALASEPERRLSRRDERATQSYASTWRAPCQHDGCMSTDLVGGTAYCERHEHKVRG